MALFVNTVRNADEKVEEEVAAFLDENFYSRPIFWSAVRTTDRQRQIHGSDIVVSIPVLGIEEAVVDEKVAISFVNRPLNTYALEVSFFNRAGKEQLGWLMKPDSITTHYLFQWIRADVNSWKEITKDNITEIEVMLIPKRAITNLLNETGLTYKNILEINRKIRAGGGIPYFTKKDRWWKFSLSNRKPIESPVNIVIDKWVYRKLAVIHAFVKPKKK